MGEKKKTGNKIIGGNVMLYAQKVEIASDNAEGYIKSAGFVSEDEATPQRPAKGFIIRWNGNCEFNDGKFRGRIEAEEGYFRGRIEAEEGYFRGTIESGPVYISNENTAPVPPTVFQANEKIRDVVTTLGANKTINIDDGSFGSKQGLSSIQTQAGVSGDYGTGITYPTYILRLNFNDGTNQILTATNYMGGSVDRTIGSVLTIGGSAAGNIFRIYNLPVGGANLPVGTVYRDNSGYLKIVT